MQLPGVCDVAETCTGFAASCPINVFLPSTVECRPWSGVCDVAENCSGTSAPVPSTDMNQMALPATMAFTVMVLTPVTPATAYTAGDPCPGTQCNTCQETLGSCLDPAGTACGDHANTDCT